jgi:diaminohydroxyphosphoribosylaminopyrimidine deaminase/5-amino-6-(5-phosphoribosylamino)uracil reductase
VTGAGTARVTLKLATSLDGKIALANGESRWITGPESRAEVHRMRARSSMIITGSGTILSDDPLFTARVPGETPKQPDLVVLDRRGRVPETARIFTVKERETRLDRSGDLAAILPATGEVMIEAGAEIAAAAVASGLVDRIEWFRAPVVLGGEGRPVVAALGLETLEKAPTFRRVRVVERGADLQERYERIR